MAVTSLNRSPSCHYCPPRGPRPESHQIMSLLCPEPRSAPTSLGAQPEAPHGQAAETQLCMRSALHTPVRCPPLRAPPIVHDDPSGRSSKRMVGESGGRASWGDFLCGSGQIFLDGTSASIFQTSQIRICNKQIARPGPRSTESASPGNGLGSCVLTQSLREVGKFPTGSEPG